MSPIDTKTMTTEWQLDELFYESADDPQIEKDINEAKKAFTTFADKYREDSEYLKDPAVLKNALEELEYLGGKKNLSKPLYYFSYRKQLDTTDQEAESRLNQLDQLYTKLSNQLTFFELSLGNIPEEKQEEFLSDDHLEHYHKYLKRVFEEAKYDLSEKEENILSLTSLPRTSMWVSGVQKAINQKTVEWDGEELPLPKALNQLHNLESQKDREALHKKCMAKLQEESQFAESEMNALATNKKIMDEVRGFEKPYSATALGYENDEAEIESLVEVITDNFSVSKDFYDLKAEFLEVDRLTYADRQARIGELDTVISFDTAVEMVSEHFEIADPVFSQIFHDMLTNGQIDVFPKEGKTGGAFCSSATYLPTMVLLNHIEDFNSVMTLAHEMGHAIHSEMTHEAQEPMYDGYPISLAEVASTFFESVVFEAVFETLSDEEKLVALHDKINRKVSTIFRQVAFFNFELAFHTQLREKGALSHQEIAELMNEHMQAYLGDRFELAEHDGYFFINVSHLRRPFYVYSYAYGDLLSSAMYKKYQEDPGFIEKVKTFLSSGSSKRPEDLFASIGIDTTDTAVFETGLTEVKDDIKKLRELTNK